MKQNFKFSVYILNCLLKVCNMLNGVLNWDDGTMIQVLQLLYLQNSIKPSQADSGLMPRRGRLPKKVSLAYPHCCMNFKIIHLPCALFSLETAALRHRSLVV
jgi:hypothetical protein